MIDRRWSPWKSSQRSNTKEIVIDGAIGAAAGAAIGGILGAGGGALYGVNETRKNDTHYRDAYASCMRLRGYTS